MPRMPPLRAIELIDAAATRFGHDDRPSDRGPSRIPSITSLPRSTSSSSYERAIRHSDRGIGRKPERWQRTFVIPTLGMKSSALRRLGESKQATEPARSIERRGSSGMIKFAVPLLARAWVSYRRGDLRARPRGGCEGSRFRPPPTLTPSPHPRRGIRGSPTRYLPTRPMHHYCPLMRPADPTPPTSR